MTIGEELQNWSDFYGTVAGVAGTLAGLLFVALALRPEIMKDTSPPGLRVWCVQTFRGLVVMLAFSLVFLIPDPSSTGIGIAIVLVSLSSLQQSVVDIRTLRQDPDPRWSRNYAGLKHFGYSIVAYLMTTAIGLSLISNRSVQIDWMVAPIFLLLMNAAVNSWNILKEAGNLPER